jgi:hypothetical protein
VAPIRKAVPRPAVLLRAPALCCLHQLTAFSSYSIHYHKSCRIIILLPATLPRFLTTIKVMVDSGGSPTPPPPTQRHVQPCLLLAFISAISTIVYSGHLIPLVEGHDIYHTGIQHQRDTYTPRWPPVPRVLITTFYGPRHCIRKPLTLVYV